MPDFFKDAKWIVWAGLVVPALFIFFKAWEKEWSTWIPIGCAVAAVYFFNEQFIAKSEVRLVQTNVPGPDEPFRPPSSEQWKYDMDENGNYVPRKVFEPPINRGYGQQPPQYPGYYNRR